MERVLLYLYTLDYPGHLKPEAVPEVASTGHTTPSSSTLASNLSPKDEEDPSSERPTGSALGNASDKQKTDCLVLHVRVHALADMFDIPSLRILANKKFVGIIDSQPWPPNDFVAATLEVIRSTPSNDSLLRKTVRNLCAKHLNKTKHPDDDSEHEKQPQRMDPKSWKLVLGEDIDFTWDVIEQTAEMHHSSSSAREDLYRDRIQDVLDGLAVHVCSGYVAYDSCWAIYTEVEGSGPLPDYKIKCQGCAKGTDILIRF